MRVLVTGGAGFIGSHVVDAALAAGHEVAVVDDLSHGKRENVAAKAALFVVDLRDQPALQEVIQGFRPDAVSHQAAQASVSVSVREPLFDAEVNAIGTLHLLQACVQSGVRRLVLASTGGAIYGEVPEGQAASEGWPAKPQSPYAISKLAAEGYVHFFARQHGLQTSVLRYANVYGPRQDAHGEAGVVAIFLERLQGELPHPLLNIGTGVATNTHKLATLLIACTRPSAVQLLNAPPRAGDLQRSVLDATLCRQVLGRLRSLEEGLERMAEASGRSTHG